MVTVSDGRVVSSAHPDKDNMRRQRQKIDPVIPPFLSIASTQIKSICYNYEDVDYKHYLVYKRCGF
jgi:D-mannonate dehydratase